MRRLIKWVLGLFLLGVVVVVALLLSKDAITRSLVEREIRAQTGMDVKIGRFSIGLLSPVVTIERFRLYNPPEFGGTLFIDIPELHIEYDRAAMSERRLHIKLARFELSEFNIVRNEAGLTNLASLMQKKAAAPGPAKPGQPKPAAADAGFKFEGVDVLNLSLGTKRYIDLKEPKNSRELNLNIHDQVFKNIKSMTDVYGVLGLIYFRSGGNMSGFPLATPPQVTTLPSAAKPAPVPATRPTPAAPAKTNPGSAPKR